MDTTRLSDREINMLAGVVSNGFRMKSEIQLKFHLVCTMLNTPLIIPLEMPLEIFYFRKKYSIESIFYVYNTSGRFSRTFLGDCLAAVCHDEIEMIHGILRNG